MSDESTEVVQESIADILKGGEPPAEPEVEQKAEPEAKPEAKPEAETKPSRERDEQGRFKAREPEQAQEPKEEVKEPSRVKPEWVDALIAERRKRQAAEAQALQQQQQKPTSVLEDEDRAFSERLSQQQAQWNERFFRLSLKAAQAGRGDYEEVASTFLEAAERDPQLIDAMRADDDPGEFIYVMGKQLKELGDVGGDITKYREKVIGEVQGQIAEKDKRIQSLEQEVASLKKQYEELSTVGKSLNTVTSGRQSIAATDDEDISQIVRFGSRSG